MGEDGSTASGTWENCMVGACMHIADLFFNNFLKMVNFLKVVVSWLRTPDSWILDNCDFTVYLLIWI
jgi:hypothetical protein